MNYRSRLKEEVQKQPEEVYEKSAGGRYTFTERFVCKKNTFRILVLFTLMGTFVFGCMAEANKNTRNRIIVSSDIGGNDPDDFQSLVHFLVYANEFDIEGLISSPPYAGRKKHILEVIDAYEKDYDKLQEHGNFPLPDSLRNITKQGAIHPQPDSIPDTLSEGAQWIITKALEEDDRPLYIQVWGSITDVAQAVHHNPAIKEKIRVYFIGSWNTRQDTNARNYLYDHHPDLWWIENNTTFRGMYMGGYQEEDYGNDSFVMQHVKGHGALGDLYWSKKKTIKMGDTPSVLYFLDGDPANPEGESWGGSFIPADHGPYYWTDNPDTTLIVNGREGAKTVSKYRKEYLEDWKERMDWIKEK
ncbi:MAG: DUF1593 domain-containing protein [Bacteroidota bacterium]